MNLKLFGEGFYAGWVSGFALLLICAGIVHNCAPDHTGDRGHDCYGNATCNAPAVCVEVEKKRTCARPDAVTIDGKGVAK